MPKLRWFYLSSIFTNFFSEYDSEMDDFIDDSEANIDISAQIRNIFGYDRRKFRDEVGLTIYSTELLYSCLAICIFIQKVRHTMPTAPFSI